MQSGVQSLPYSLPFRTQGQQDSKDSIFQTFSLEKKRAQRRQSPASSEFAVLAVLAVPPAIFGCVFPFIQARRRSKAARSSAPPQLALRGRVSWRRSQQSPSLLAARSAGCSTRARTRCPARPRRDATQVAARTCPTPCSPGPLARASRSQRRVGMVSAAVSDPVS
jgi:hypothetical protein